MAFSRFRHPLRTVRKRFFKTVSTLKLDSSGKPDLDSLLKTGVTKFLNHVPIELIDEWKRDYSIYQSSFKPADGNITFPFYNQGMHDLLIDSDFMRLIEQYFYWVYRRKPVLQTIPSVIITYPNITQKDFDSSKNHFPAGWHIDYPYEFTVHIPLEPISALTSHTKYILGSQYRLGSPSLNDNSLEEDNVLDCMAEPGDILCLDVEGWHRAQLELNSYRAMIQLKFTTGNDLLYYHESNKQDAIINRSLGGIKDASILKAKFKKDLSFIESLEPVSSINIINDNKSIYIRYI